MSAHITILLAEDNPGDVFLVRRALEKHGLEADLVVVEDGQAALRYLDRIDSEAPVEQAAAAQNAVDTAEKAAPARVPDLALLDLNLPRATGSRILMRIRQSERCGAIPAIIITSSDSPLDRAAAEQMGATGYFQKPGDLAGFMELGRIVRNALNGILSRGAGG